MQPDHIIIHHSLTKDGQTVSWNAIRGYHMLTLGWQDIGYHYGIELVGNHYEILLGRMMNETGAHCSQKGMNRRSLGICFIANFDVQHPDVEQWDLGLKLVRSLIDVLGIPRENIYGHCEFATYKTCPGRHFDLELFRQHLGNEYFA